MVEMKQRIDPKQLKELSEDGKKRLRKWWKPKEGDWAIGKKTAFLVDRANNSPEWLLSQKTKYLPLLSIGQLIEFLDENKSKFELKRYKFKKDKNYNGWELKVGKWWDSNIHRKLCGALWESVKEILNENKGGGKNE